MARPLLTPSASIALFAPLLFAACAPEPEPEAIGRVEPLPDAWVEAPPTAGARLISRFTPGRAVAGAEVRIVVTFNGSGCLYDGTCAVEIGDQPADVVDEHGLLRARSSRWANAGPLCVTWHTETHCVDFEVMAGPELNALASRVDPDGGVWLEAIGDGFLEDAYVTIGWERPETLWEGPSRLVARVPEHVLAAPGDYEVRVFSPSTGRCGAPSEPIVWTVE
jgi:hypothetical protein